MKKVLLVLLVLLGCVGFSKGAPNTNINSSSYVTDVSVHHHNNPDTRTLLVQEVNKYLQDIKAAKDVSADVIVRICLKENFDIAFLLAQGTLETQMGVTGIGKTRNSMFGVIRHKPKSRNDAVAMYVELIKTSYLSPKKTYQSLLKNFISNDGYRYGGANYESHLKKYYNNVCQNYNIQKLQGKI